MTAHQLALQAIEPREVCIHLGPSGCGKSTVLRMIAGLEVPSGEAIMLTGRHVDSPEKDPGMEFQSYTSFHWLRVWENGARG